MTTKTTTNKIGDTVQYLTISNNTRTVRITGFDIDDDGQQTFTGEWLDITEEEMDDLGNEVWGYVSDIIASTNEPQTSRYQANVDVIAHQISTEAISIQNTFDRSLGNIRFARWDYEEELMREIRLAVYEPTREETHLAVARCFRLLGTNETKLCTTELELANYEHNLFFAEISRKEYSLLQERTRLKARLAEIDAELKALAF